MSAVIPSWKEPLPGYSEGMHGANGWCLAAGRGVLRTMHCQYQYPCNTIQCDIVVNALIVLAYERSKVKYALILLIYFDLCATSIQLKNIILEFQITV